MLKVLWQCGSATLWLPTAPIVLLQATEDIMLAIAAHKGLAAYALGASIVESGVSVVGEGSLTRIMPCRVCCVAGRVVVLMGQHTALNSMGST